MTQPRLLGGRYELGAVIGRGGMAEVFRARDLRLDRTVAIKTLRTDLARDATFQARFRREAQSAASLNHPSIIAVYDTGEDDFDGQPVPYIVMELVEGHTLRELIRPENGQERRLRPERALEIVDGILRALDYSHRGGIIHRDIKPANVMLTRDHEVKVMDFGIARAMSDSAATMTATAQVIGTAQYLSPEQARGERVDARSDLYSTGCVLYELLTARPPFQGDSPVAIAYQHVREEPIPPSQLDPEIPQWADRIVLKAMTKDPAHRYQSASEFRADIQRAMQGVQVASQSTSTMVVPPMAGTQVMGQVPGNPTRVQQPVGPATYAGQGGYDDLPPVRYDEATQHGGGGRRRAASHDDEPGKKAQKAALWLLLGVVVVGVFAGLAVLLTSGGDDGGDDPAANLVAIERVDGMSQDEATKALQGQGFTVDAKEQASDSVAKGKVIGTDPAGGQEVEKGSAVTLFVSIGKEKVSVPGNLVGRPFDEVQKILQGEGFLVQSQEQSSDSAEPGTVLKVQPGSGRTVNKGATINVTVAKAVAKAVVPDLLGADEVTAKARLKDEGFNKVEFTQAPAENGAAPGTVFKTNPIAGTEVPVSTTIVVYIAAQPEVPPEQTQPPVPTDPNQPDPGQQPDPGLPPEEDGDDTDPFAP
ncbi:Stk1 family PASTA domain-containing Ser/Thr kinase [Actinocorallia populi]|uniref:Stk1 family PASTA domain-containing Ser/Thr kinase n=1 Tax=Actinocorallia populi TaxID=2079200 RepID=UPI000D091DF4|nr:Stk1 family PASTA domain-containing Ser/Thr kinase [Actinocorallia populi]